jgi:hypothetical protein
MASTAFAEHEKTEAVTAHVLWMTIDFATGQEYAQAWFDAEQGKLELVVETAGELCASAALETAE